ncbi:helix-turn-helix domain-containing protein [Streptomyces sp. NPDC005494]|uniref:helix-turn-helix domain-containing protein n=1 Tax=Streptomyces sp. NPDC005494 TaxID=3364715 RepID=UPI00367D8FDF
MPSVRRWGGCARVRRSGRSCSGWGMPDTEFPPSGRVRGEHGARPVKSGRASSVRRRLGPPVPCSWAPSRTRVSVVVATPQMKGATDFEIRRHGKPQGRQEPTRERAAYFQLMRQGCSSRQGCRIVGIDVRTGRKWRNGRHAYRDNDKAAPSIYQEAPPSLSPSSRCPGEAGRIPIADRLREKAGVRADARRAGPQPSTISREIRRNRHPPSGRCRSCAARPAPMSADLAPSRSARIGGPGFQRPEMHAAPETTTRPSDLSTPPTKVHN